MTLITHQEHLPRWKLKFNELQDIEKLLGMAKGLSLAPYPTERIMRYSYKGQLCPLSA